MLEFNENDNLSTMDDKIHHWLEHEGKEWWPRFKEIRDSWKGDVELWEELNVWAYNKLRKEITQEDIDKEAHLSGLEIEKDHALATVRSIVGACSAMMLQLQKIGMVEGIKANIPHMLKQQLTDAVDWIREYEAVVDELLNEYGWQ